MKVIQAVNVNTAYPKGINFLQDYGIQRESRNGQVLVAPEPVTTHYRQPRERVLLSPQRDANPFFHLFEALWMLTGANDVALPAYFVPRMKEFSDDGELFHGAYGERWRHAGNEDIDQLGLIVEKLHDNPDDRRIILQMWDVERDIGCDQLSRDVPCNVIAKFEISPAFSSVGAELEPQLNMVVFNRSNDIIWGCYGANAVQFSMLQEYLAAHIGVNVGWYEHVSTNFHAYTKMWDKHYPLTDPYPFMDPYGRMDGPLQIETLVTNPATFDEECLTVIEYARTPHIIPDLKTEEMHNRFFHTVCNPMLWAYAYYRRGQLKEAICTIEKAILENREIDWLVAGEQWLRRRAARKLMVGETV
jgi:thymidylate synthase